MREKSKFITFILSFIPGLSHFYLGFADRAVIFLMVFLGVIVGVTGLSFITYSSEVFALLVFALPVIWLIALIDAFSIRKKIILLEYNQNGNESEFRSIEEIKQSNKKTITMALSIIPGAGHMYLGYQKKGLVMMAAFFFTIFFMGWLELSLFLFVLPLIWFYSFFDALHSFNKDSAIKEDIEIILPNIKPQWIGWGLIITGVLIVAERILYPLIPNFIRNYIQTSIVSIIFIAGGIKLLLKSKRKNQEKDGKEIWEEDE